MTPSPVERGARLAVDDNGPGVPAEARERIFDPYVTTKENGTGLGLAIVRKIVLDHGGDVHVDEQAVAPRRGALRGHFADRGGIGTDRSPSCSRRTTVDLGDELAEHGGGGAGEPRLQAAAAHPGAQHTGVVDGQRRRVQRLLAAVGERQLDGAGRVDAGGARDERRVRHVSRYAKRRSSSRST